MGQVRPAAARDGIAAFGFVRVAAATPRAFVADPKANAENIITLAREADNEGATLVVCPELCLSGYAIDDLLFQDALLDEVEAAIVSLAAASEALGPALLVGAPLRHRDRLYNCAVLIAGGAVIGVTPKTFLPNYREFYEKRHFASGAGIEGETIAVAGVAAPFGVDLLFCAEGSADFILHAEICEDLWAPTSPSTAAALAGAKLLANLSASNAVVGKADHRAMLCAAQSARAVAAYVFAAAGAGESSTDLAWDGQSLIHENGLLLAQGPRFSFTPHLCCADIDLDLLRQERMRASTFRDAQALSQKTFRRVAFPLSAATARLPLRRPLARFPFVPNDPTRLDQDCYEAYNIQLHALAQRLTSARIERLTLGVSGGLDSTQALIVAANTMDALGLPRANILAFSLPGFATSETTRTNAAALAASLGATFEEIDIRPAARQMLADLGHPFAKGESVYDVTFENVQAGLRTDYLFRIANQRGALVLGTGDLSELALGWCTYGVGDHMSHYNVNAGAPKTLIQHLIRWNAERRTFGPATSELLLRILDTEISPELVPSEDGTIQSTEDAIGPYALHDFFIFYLLRYGFRPDKIAMLAEEAWADADRGEWPPGLLSREKKAFSRAEILRWMAEFARRFFASQFKRSALPNGPKIMAGGSLSPRGDWRAPSDAGARVWLDAVAALQGRS